MKCKYFVFCDWQKIFKLYGAKKVYKTIMTMLIGSKIIELFYMVDNF